MKKIRKTISVLAIGALMASSVAACGNKSESAPADTSAAAETQAAGDTSAPAADGATFKIGGIGPITGAAAIYGQAVKNGTELAVKEINEAGGINGYQVELNYQDDEHDAEKSVNAYNTLKDWGAQMLVGCVTSKPCEAVAEESYVDNMFQLTPSGSSAACVVRENVFRVCFSDPNQGVVAAKYIAENKLANKIAVIYDSSDSYSAGIYQNFATEAANQNLEIVAAEAFTADSNKDFSVQLQKAKDGGAELVFLPIYYTEASLILSQADNMGFKPVFYGCDGLDGLLNVENFDTALAEGVLLQTPFTTEATDDLTKNFVAAFEAAYGEKPNQFAADAYDAVYIIKAAAESKSLTPDMSVSDIGDAMKTAMTEITFTGTTGKDITWTADGEPNKAPLVVEIVDGAYKLME